MKREPIKVDEALLEWCLRPNAFADLGSLGRVIVALAEEVRRLRSEQRER